MKNHLPTLVAAMVAISLTNNAQEAKPADAKPAEPAAAAAATAKPADTAPSGDPLAGVPLDKVSYFIGSNIGKQMGGQGFTPDYDAFKAGLQDSVEKKALKYPQAELEAAMEKFRGAMMAMDQKRMAESAKKGEQFLVDNGKRKEVTTTASGLQYEVLKAGEGAKPLATDTVKVHYKGTLTNGEEFDSSYSRNEPATFPLNGVIPGWTEGVQLMAKGAKFKFVIPGKLAYGENGSPPKIGPNETLVFEVELLDINPK
jgi:FKBP-type peptidyl-prolyl cis-trans isomerase